MIKTNIRDLNFGVSKLADKARMIHSRLYIKINLLTQKSSSQFIREIRLNKALELDSNYCLAYANLADVYVAATWFGYYIT